MCTFTNKNSDIKFLLCSNFEKDRTIGKVLYAAFLMWSMIIMIQVINVEGPKNIKYFFVVSHKIFTSSYYEHRKMKKHEKKHEKKT